MVSSLAALVLVACAGTGTDPGETELAITSMPVADLEACGVDPTERTRLLGLSPQDFDQDMDGGWRAVVQRPGCELAAASLLETYITDNGIEPDDGVMHWHLGQLLALSGDGDAAIPWLEATRRADLAWNLYVDGTIAFLDRDRSALSAATESLAATEVSEAEKASRRRFLADNPEITMPDGFVDEPANLRVLEGLLACFGEPYSVAYGCER